MQNLIDHHSFETLITGGHSAGSLAASLNFQSLQDVLIYDLSQYLVEQIQTHVNPDHFTLTNIWCPVTGEQQGLESVEPQVAYGSPSLVFTFQTVGGQGGSKTWFKSGPLCVWGTDTRPTRASVTLTRLKSKEFNLNAYPSQLIKHLYKLVGMVTKNLVKKTSRNNVNPVFLSSHLKHLPLINLVLHWPAHVWYANKRILNTPLWEGLNEKTATYSLVEFDLDSSKELIEESLLSISQLINNSTVALERCLPAGYYLYRSLFSVKPNFSELKAFTASLIGKFDPQIGELLTSRTASLRLLKKDKELDEQILSYYLEKT
jgi:hypothetical protein